jgi:hypothetical protein
VLSEGRESVDYLISSYGVGEAEALRRLELQRSAPALAKMQGVAASNPEPEAQAELLPAPPSDPDCLIAVPSPPSGLCEWPPMRGGLRLDIRRQDGTVGGCTSGFNVEGLGVKNDNERYVLTAGHCVLGHNHEWIDHTYHRGRLVGVEAAAIRRRPFPATREIG